MYKMKHMSKENGYRVVRLTKNKSFIRYTCKRVKIVAR